MAEERLETPAEEPAGAEPMPGEPTEPSKEKTETVRLRDAVKAGDTDLVADLIDAGTDFEFRGLDDFPPVLHAIVEGHLSTVQLLVERGASINTVSFEHEFSGLILLAQRGTNHQMLVYLLDQGANVEQRDVFGRTAVMWAVHQLNEYATFNDRKRKTIVTELLDRGASVGALCNARKKALNYAHSGGEDDDIFRQLLEEAATGQRLVVPPKMELCLVERVIDTYTGTMDPEGFFVGMGEVQVSNGHVFSGHVKSSVMHGRGVYQWGDDVTYEGQFYHHEISGQGRLQWPDGSLYEGGVLKGRRHGEGVFKSGVSSIQYEGWWAHGMRNGYGVLKYDGESDVVYKGEWKNNRKHGKGMIHYPSGNIYDGEWKSDLKAGFGRMTWVDLKERYDGEWEDGVQHGKGKHVWLERGGDDNANAPSPFPLCNRYEGDFRNGHRHGYGVFVYANGARYEGSWAKNVKHGRGTFTFEDGRVYVGEFNNDTMVDEVPKNQLPPGGDQFKLDLSDLKFPEVPEIEWLTQVYAIFMRFNTELRGFYRHYSNLGAARVVSTELEGVYAMTMRQFWELATDCELYSLELPLAEINKLFVPITNPVLCTRSGAPLCTPRAHMAIIPGSPHHPDTFLLYRQFIEGLARLAYYSYPKLKTMGQRLQALMTNKILPLACEVSDDFRTELMGEDVETVLRSHRTALLNLFEFYSKKDDILESVRRRDHTLSCKKYLLFIRDSKVTDDDLTLAKAIQSIVRPIYVPCQETKDNEDAIPEVEPEGDESTDPATSSAITEALGLELCYHEFVLGICHAALLKIAFSDMTMAEKVQEFISKHLLPNLRVY